MKILLTGGNGLMGRAIKRVQADLRLPVSISAPGRRELNLLDQQAVTNHFTENSYDAVIHCAATVGGIRANMGYPTEFLAENVLINTFVIEGARKAGVRDFIYFGSSCMYPKDLGKFLTEDDILTAPLEPTNEGYALAKIAGSRHCDAISRQYGLNYRTIIPCNLYGPDDHFDLDRAHLVPAVLRKIYEAQRTGADGVTIWGDGTALREFLYVDDIARFVLKSVDRVGELPSVLNVGAGVDHTVNHYYEVAAKIIGYSGRFIHDLSQPVGMLRKIMDVSKARSLGWNAPTSLEEGMRLTYEGMLRSLKERSDR